MMSSRISSWLLAFFTIASLGAAHAPAMAQSRLEEFAYRRYEVDTSRDTPFACLNFTQPLDEAQAQRYRDFLRIEPQVQPAIRVSGVQLCLGGLAYGRRYEIELRPGLPSATGQRLAASELVQVELADREPVLSFGNGLILPRESEAGVPLSTVNVERVRIAIYRVPDRYLFNVSPDSLAERGFSRWQVRSIEREQGAAIWRGDMAVRQSRNESVTTLVPLVQALRDRQPGLYLIVARNARDAERPATADDDDDDSAVAAQWVLETDIGLLTLAGGDGLNVFARSFNTARPLAGVEMVLIANNNDVLARARTDANGHVRFAAGLMRGNGAAAPRAVQAFGSGDFSYLDLRRPAFDLSDRGVDGRTQPGPVDAFLYTERGIYRPRETVNVVALLRDRIANAMPGQQIVLSVRRPDGVEFRRATLPDGGAGAAHYAVTLTDTAPRGRWEVIASLDGNNAVGRVGFQVEDFVPQRLRVEARPAEPAIRVGEDFRIDVQADFLYGAPGADLRAEAEGRITVDPAPFANFTDYSFGLVSDAFRDDVLEIQPQQTNAQGRAQITGRIENPPETSRPLRAQINVAVIEPGGRAVREQVTMPIRTRPIMIGVRNATQDAGFAEATDARFDVIAVDQAGAAVARRGITWQIARETYTYRWVLVDGRWRFQSQLRQTEMGRGDLATPAGGPAQVTRRLEWGFYRLTLRDAESGAATSTTFAIGWGSNLEDERPDRAEIVADRRGYNAGDRARIAIRAPSPGQALVVIANDRVLEHHLVTIGADGTGQLELTVGSDWGAGAYALVTTYRPLGERAQRRAPVRAIGVAWLGIDPASRTLQVAIDAPDRVRPRQRIEVPVRVTNATAGQQVYLTLAAVDEGILLLTRYQTPAPTGWYFGRRRLALDIRDDYGRLITGDDAAVGQLREGGDSLGGPGLDVVPIRIVSLFSGIVRADANGVAQVPLDIPDFNGELRLMAVAWDATRVGSAARPMVVRDPVVAEAIFPRFLAPGDRSTITVVVHNVEGQAGPYTARVSATGPVRIGQAPQDVTLQVSERRTLPVPFEGLEPGIATIRLAVSGPGFQVERDWQIQVRPAQAPITEESIAVLRPGDTLRVERSVLDDFVPGTGQVAVTLSSIRGFDVPGLMRALDRYPFGCLEQTTSRAFPMLVYDDLRLLGRVDADRGIRRRVQDAINRVVDMQMADGQFGMWSPFSASADWISVYAVDFLMIAKTRGYDVSDQVLRRAETFLRRLAISGSVESVEAQAYALYLLARAGGGSLGDTRAFFDTRRNNVRDALSMAQLAAALQSLGDRARAREALQGAIRLIGSRPPKEYYGSPLRDLSGFIAVAAEVGDNSLLTQLIQRLDIYDRGADRATTQEMAWMLRAAGVLANNNARVSVGIDGAAGEERADPAHIAIADADLARGIVFRNTGTREYFRTVSVQGVPRVPLPAISRGLTVQRDFYTMAGQRVDLARVTQNDRLVVVVSGRVLGNEYAEIAVMDLLPAGFEIEAPLQPVEPGTASAMNWLPRLRPTSVQESRDDRYVAAFTVAETPARVDPFAANTPMEQRRDYAVAYLVRAITPGTYVLPGASAEDMYRSAIRARGAPGTVVIAPRS